MSSRAGRAIGPAVPHGLRQRRSAGQGCRDHRQIRIPVWSTDSAWRTRPVWPMGQIRRPGSGRRRAGALAALPLTMIEGR
jgi:hypothetical protein